MTDVYGLPHSILGIQSHDASRLRQVAKRLRKPIDEVREHWLEKGELWCREGKHWTLCVKVRVEKHPSCLECRAKKRKI